MASIGYYWDEKTMYENGTLLREYEDLFTQSFTKMKGINEGLGEMKTDL
jgi:hypothetical protein